MAEMTKERYAELREKEKEGKITNVEYKELTNYLFENGQKQQKALEEIRDNLKTANEKMAQSNDNTLAVVNSNASLLTGQTAQSETLTKLSETLDKQLKALEKVQKQTETPQAKENAQDYGALTFFVLCIILCYMIAKDTLFRAVDF